MQRRAGVPLWAAALTMAVLMIPCVPAAAEDHDEPPPPSIYQHWVVWPKAGQAAQFEEAAKKFLAWSKAQGEGFRWFVSQPVVGDDLTFYVFRAGPFHWKDLDAQEEWANEVGVQQNWNENVAAHVERFEHYLMAWDHDHSLWHDSDDYRYFGVSMGRLKPGAYNSMIDALKRIRKVAGDHDWKPGWGIQWVIGGSDTDLAIVTPYRSYAEMAEPETPFPKMLAETLGTERGAQDLLTQLNASFESGGYLIARDRPDLSTQE